MAKQNQFSEIETSFGKKIYGRIKGLWGNPLQGSNTEVHSGKYARKDYKTPLLDMNYMNLNFQNPLGNGS